MDPLGIEGARVFTPRVHKDGRGSFWEMFCGDEFAADQGYRFTMAQASFSVSRRGVIRGIHYADVPPGQAKYVSCTRGAVLDVVVDLRTGSPGFSTWAAVQLDEQSRKGIFLAEGLGHGFMALTDDATMLYLCSTSYLPSREHGVHPLDPALGIDWPRPAPDGEHGHEPVLSAKDAAAPSLADLSRAGQLPSYQDCLDYAALLRRG